MMRKPKILLLIGAFILLIFNIKHAYDNSIKLDLSSKIVVKLPKNYDFEFILYSNDINKLALYATKMKILSKYAGKSLLKFLLSSDKLINGDNGSFRNLSVVERKCVFLLSLDEETSELEILLLLPDFYKSNKHLHEVHNIVNNIFTYEDYNNEYKIFYTKIGNDLVCSKSRNYLKKFILCYKDKHPKELLLNFDNNVHFKVICDFDLLNEKIFKNADTDFLLCELKKFFKFSNKLTFDGIIFNDTLILKHKYDTKLLDQAFDVEEEKNLKVPFDKYSVFSKNSTVEYFKNYENIIGKLDKKQLDDLIFIFDKLKSPFFLGSFVNDDYETYSESKVFLYQFDCSTKDILINVLLNTQLCYQDEYDTELLIVKDFLYDKLFMHNEHLDQFKFIKFYDSYAIVAANKSDILKYLSLTENEKFVSLAELTTYSRCLLYLAKINILKNLPSIISNVSYKWHALAQIFLIELEYILLEIAYIPKYKQNEVQILFKSKD